MIICDEPVSALDVSVQSQVLNLMMDLQSDLGLSYLFIAHDLAVVRHVSDRVAIMYLGKIMEIADADAIYENPRHAYTKALISAIPIPDPTKREDPRFLEGDVPSPNQSARRVCFWTSYGSSEVEGECGNGSSAARSRAGALGATLPVLHESVAGFFGAGRYSGQSERPLYESRVFQGRRTAASASAARAFTP